MAKKVYQTIQYVELRHSIIHNGQVEIIIFGGGFMTPFVQQGRFETDNVELQNSLETDPYFDIFFELEAVYETPEVLESENTNLGVVTGADGITSVNGITTNTQAKEYLLKNFPDKVKVSQMVNKAAIIEIAKELNVIFPELPE